jgi:hypothetical protein
MVTEEGYFKHPLWLWLGWGRARIHKMGGRWYANLDGTTVIGDDLKEVYEYILISWGKPKQRRYSNE